MKKNKKDFELKEDDLAYQEPIDKCNFDGEYVPDGKCISKFSFSDN